MSAQEVIDLYALFEKQGIQVWIDGGWAVDALLGEQTRGHQDLDIAVQRKDFDALQKLLQELGYKNSPREEDKMWDLVLVNNEGKEIEVHAFSFDAEGRVVAEQDWNGYSADSLEGAGIIAGTEVRCVSLSQLVKTHDKNKRQLKASDYQDMERLSQKFGVVFP